ncbi:MAG: transcriptional repressor LexA [Nitrospirae bacterium]|nr:MAG: transcriptional repressor LexA [Nitrospirota bacterium]
MALQLTNRQELILNFVEQYTAAHHYPPTLREIADHHGLSSLNGVKKHLSALAKKGRLVRKAGARRALHLTRDASQVDGVSVPILGRIAAGPPLLAEEQVLDRVVLDRSLVRWDRPFLLRVKGDSMVGAGILDGDHVLVKAQDQAEPGELVVALLDDEATVKRLARTADGYELQPENPKYAPIPLTPDGPVVRILGKVQGVLRLPSLV